MFNLLSGQGEEEDEEAATHGAKYKLWRGRKKKFVKSRKSSDLVCPPTLPKSKTKTCEIDL